MANDKPVTESKLISVLKDFRKDIQSDIQNSANNLRKEFKSDLKIQGQAIRKEFKFGLSNLRKEFKSDLDKQSEELKESFLETLAHYHNGETIPRLNEIIKQVESIDQRLKWVKNDLKDIQIEFSTDKASKKEFNELFSKVTTMQKELERVKIKIGLTN